MPTNQPRQVTAPTSLDWLGLGFLVLAWASSFSVMKIALTDVGPYWLAAARISLGALVFILIAMATGAPLPRGRQWLAGVVLGLVGNTFPFVLIGWATLFVPSGTAGLMMATNPILTMLIAIVLLPEERVTAGRIAGLALGFAGAALVISGRGAVIAGPDVSLAPYLALLGGAFCYALGTVSARRYGDIPPLQRAIATLVVAAVGAIILAVLVEPLPVSVSAPSWAAVIYLGLFPTALATMVIFWVVDRTSAGFLAQTNYLVPVGAVMFGALLFAEQLGWRQYAGLAIILTGIAIAERVWASKKA
jgi:drug/metabolite transporter (DMT)-like permease